MKQVDLSVLHYSAMSHKHINDYLKEITAICVVDGDATEFSYRTAIDNLLRSTATELSITVDILQEPSRTKNIGAPDFRISAKGGGVIGYVECKKPGANLRALTTRKQLEKYRELSANILLTDSWSWKLLRGGKLICSVALIETADEKTKTEFTELLRVFMQAEAEKIGDSKRLASALASRCAMLRTGFRVELRAYEDDGSSLSRLHSMLVAFRVALNSELSFEQFADTFAQTLVYSLLFAKLKAPAATTLDLYDINRYIPMNFELIREITSFLQDLNDPKYQNIAWAVDDILAIINAMDAEAVTQSMSYRNQSGNKGFTDADDPYLYFYENFLAAYDAKLREQRGVYYTPPPVVNFIARAVDDLLRSDFQLSDGLATFPTVTVLDFAAGTGTFMLEMIRTMFTGKTPAWRKMRTHGHILKNFYGFELLIAPYVIAHLKLSQFLADNGVPLQKDQRINIYLTNTLEQISRQIELPAMPKLAKEANYAQSVKESPVLVITGNPPYSVESQNKGEWITKLIKTYKYIDDEKLQEQNLKLLQDDYVKFIRFAQWKMERAKRGIVAIITNRGFLDNPTFRGMRKSLLGTFDTLYFLDLHGNIENQKNYLHGEKDENVFDIRRGVAISIFIKSPLAKKQKVFYADLYGRRSTKFEACLALDMSSVQWKEITPAKPFYFFIPHDIKAASPYQKLYSIKDIFATHSTGIKTHRDHFAFAFEKKEIKERINNFIDKNVSTEKLRKKYILKDSGSWRLENMRISLKKNHSFNKFLKPCLYRPFDIRWCYYSKETMERHRPEVMHHMLAGENLGLVSVRQARTSNTWQHCFVSEKLIECCYISNKGGESNSLYPLYRYDSKLGVVDEYEKTENFTPEFRNWINEKYSAPPPPENILGCIYAILHSPNYRQRYAESLRVDYPRIPFPDDANEFARLAEIGKQLINAHLLRDHCDGDFAQHQSADSNTSNRVEKVRYYENTERLYFNKTEWFANIPPRIFAFKIGAYQPLDKYLKSRKNRILTLHDTETIRKIAGSINFTIEKMEEIDQL